MDLQLILEGVEKFLFFNTRDQSVEMRNVPIESCQPINIDRLGLQALQRD